MEIGVNLSNKQLNGLAAGGALDLAIPAPLALRTYVAAKNVRLVFMSLPDGIVSSPTGDEFVYVDTPGDGTGLVRIMGTLIDPAAPLVGSKVRSKIEIARYRLQHSEAAGYTNGPVKLQWPKDLYFDGASLIDTNKGRLLFL